MATVLHLFSVPIIYASHDDGPKTQIKEQPPSSFAQTEPSSTVFKPRSVSFQPPAMLRACDRLPAELVAIILDLVAHSDPAPKEATQSTILSVSQVSSVWRSVALNAPHLWADINTCLPMSIFVLHLQRSRTNPLFITLDTSANDYLLKLRTLCQGYHSARWFRLILTAHNRTGMDTTMSLLSGAITPMLQTAQLIFQGSASEAPYMVNNSTLLVGAKMTSLCLHNVGFDVSALRPFATHISNLELRDSTGNPAISFPTLQDVLQSFTSLRRLTIIGVVVRPLRTAQLRDFIRLPHLEYLAIGDISSTTTTKSSGNGGGNGVNTTVARYSAVQPLGMILSLNLRELRLHWLVDRDVGLHFTSDDVNMRYGQLETLDLDYTQFSTGLLKRVAQQTPGVRRIRIASVHHWPVRNLCHILEQRETVLWPKLRHVEVKGIIGSIELADARKTFASAALQHRPETIECVCKGDR